MLKVKNLSRAYKVKSGSDVYALNNVSLEFPKTGMVFIFE
jgi:ABC-type oligopeptide transport system ATPase subunit